MEEDKFGNVEVAPAKISAKCLICGKYVELTDMEARGICIKVCDECKAAVAWAKTQIPYWIK